MMKALTKAVMKAKISSPLPEGVDEVVHALRVLLGDLGAGDHLGAIGDHVLDRRSYGLGVGALGEPDVDRVDLAVRTEVVERGVEVEGDDRRAAETVGVAEADRRG